MKSWSPFTSTLSLGKFYIKRTGSGTSLHLCMVIARAREHTQIHGHGDACSLLFPPCSDHSVPSPESCQVGVGTGLLSGREGHKGRVMVISEPDAEATPTAAPIRRRGSSVLKELLPPLGLGPPHVRGACVHTHARIRSHTPQSRQPAAPDLGSSSTV